MRLIASRSSGAIAAVFSGCVSLRSTSGRTRLETGTARPAPIAASGVAGVRRGGRLAPLPLLSRLPPSASGRAAPNRLDTGETALRPVSTTTAASAPAQNSTTTAFIPVDRLPGGAPAPRRIADAAA